METGEIVYRCNNGEIYDNADCHKQDIIVREAFDKYILEILEKDGGCPFPDLPCVFCPFKIKCDELTRIHLNN